MSGTRPPVVDVPTGWAIPVASDISLSAFDRQAGDFTDTATLTVAPVPGVSAAEAYGSLSTQYTFAVTNTANSSQVVNQVGNPGGGPDPAVRP